MDGFVIKKPTKIHSRSHARRMKEVKRKGFHYAYIKRKGTTKAKARLSTKILWKRGIRVQYKEHMDHNIYMKVKGNVFKEQECDDGSHKISTLNLRDKV